MVSNPVHPHCGPGNVVSATAPQNEIDRICWKHDIAYGILQKQHGYYWPYLVYNKADSDFIDEIYPYIHKSDLALAYYLYFQGKKQGKHQEGMKNGHVTAPMIENVPPSFNVDHRGRIYSGPTSVGGKKREPEVDMNKGYNKRSAHWAEDDLFINHEVKAYPNGDVAAPMDVDAGSFGTKYLQFMGQKGKGAPVIYKSLGKKRKYAKAVKKRRPKAKGSKKAKAKRK